MPGMPMPEWYEDAVEKMGDILAEPPPPMAAPVEWERIHDLPNLFAEYGVKENDVLLHIFPRAGLEDKWHDGHYINRCHSCHNEVPIPDDPKSIKRCPRCGHTGLDYVPGRAEAKPEISFLKKEKWQGVVDLIKRAVDGAWMGTAAVEIVPEMEAFVVQLQRAKNTAKVVGLEKFARSICETLNSSLSEP